MNTKSLWSSKRLWVGIIALITGISVIATGEQSLADQLPNLVLVGIGLIQTIVAILSGNEVLTIGGKPIGGQK